jgi:Tat protein translocase TatB subunit
VFGIGFAEILVILTVALLVFGPDRLPEMTRQAASFVRDLRKMVANARRDIAVSAQDLGIDEEDLRILRELRNPKAFVRDKVLDGLELGDLGLDDDAPADNNGGSRPRATTAQPDTAAKTESASDLPYDPDAT